MFRQILFPTDFSDPARRAGAVAAELARHFAARLHLLHVVPSVTDPGTASDALRAAAVDLGLRNDTVVVARAGRPAAQIVAYAREVPVDLIVVGTHGRTGFSRVLLGSVAEAVVRLAPCRVLTVPATAPATSPAAEASPAPESRCVVCAGSTDDLVCHRCRERIRAEALERKVAAERPARRGGR